MFITGLKSEIRYPKCPHCGGLFHLDNDGYEDYFTCIMCARQFSIDLNHRPVNGYKRIDNQLLLW